MTKKLSFTFEGQQINWEEKSHAQVFRNFWNLMKETNLEKTVETIDLVGIRTAEEDMFIAKNGSKKKHIPLIEGERWIYAHLTPKAMEKVYDKFLAGWNGTYVQPEKHTKAEETPQETVTTAPEGPVFGPQQYTEDTELVRLKSAEEHAKDEIALELYGSYYEDLMPGQKGVIAKKYKAKLRAEAQQPEESQEEDLPNLDEQEQTQLEI